MYHDGTVLRITETTESGIFGGRLNINFLRKQTANSVVSRGGRQRIGQRRQGRQTTSERTENPDSVSAGARRENRGLNTGTALNVRRRFSPQRGGRKGAQRRRAEKNRSTEVGNTHCRRRFRQSMGRQFWVTKKAERNLSAFNLSEIIQRWKQQRRNRRSYHPHG